MNFRVGLLAVAVVIVVSIYVIIKILVPQGEPPLPPPVHVFNWAPPPTQEELAKIPKPRPMLEVCQIIIRKTVLSEQEKQQIVVTLEDQYSKGYISPKQRDDILAELKRQDASVEYLQCMLNYQVEHGALTRKTADYIFNRDR